MNDLNSKKIPDGYKQTKIGVIPEDWDVVKLNLLSNDIGDGIHSTPKYVDSSNYFFVNGNNLSNGRILITQDTKCISKDEYESLKKNLDNTTILMSINGTIGNLAFFNNETVILGKSAAYIKLSQRIDKMFIYYLLQHISIKQFYDNELTGTTIKNLSLASIRATPISIPPRKSEQIAIATILSDTDALIECLEKLIVKKKAIKQGAMQQLLTGKKRLPGFSGNKMVSDKIIKKDYKQTDIGVIPSDWVVKKLANVASLKARIGWQGLTTAEYKDSGEYYLITGTDFKNGFIDWENCHYVEKARYNQDKNIQIKEHDVLVTKDGTIGKVALINRISKPATLNSGVFVIRPFKNEFFPEYFYYLLLSEVFYKFLAQLSAGSTINHLYQKDFVNFSFQAPSNITEQTAIATVLSDMDAEIEKLEQKLDKYRQIKTGMMQQLLTGKIRLGKNLL